MADDLLVARGLVVAYGRPAAMFARRSAAPAVLYGIDIHVGKGETVGIVGESGSGKTTLGRALLGLVKPVAGSVIFDGRDITALDEKARRPLRRRMQMIFQDPMSSLNPRHTIGRILTEPVLLHGLAQDHAAALALVQGVLDRVGLQRNTVERYSFELSGGQRQRVGIARAVVLRPDFVVADEIVSGLDVSTQAQVLRLLKELTSEMRLALAFISHDLSVVRSICQRVVVMREGRVVEEGPCDRLFAAPGAAYTRMLIDAIPLPRLQNRLGAACYTRPSVLARSRSTPQGRLRAVVHCPSGLAHPPRTRRRLAAHCGPAASDRRGARHRVRGGGLFARHRWRLRVRHEPSALHLFLNDDAVRGLGLRSRGAHTHVA